MNWLAHALLSNPDGEFRLGNLLADVVKRADRAAMPKAFLDGVRQHQGIDAFTDTHPIVHQSRARISPAYRRFSGILVDIFYDHFLALDWDRYCPDPLDAFTMRLYADMQRHSVILPLHAQTAIARMCSEDWLASYRRIDGVEAALRRVSARLSERRGRTFELEKATSELIASFEGLQSDFAQFFPLLAARFA